MTSGSQWACEYCGCGIAKKDEEVGTFYCGQCLTQVEIVDTERDDEGIYLKSHKRKIKAPERPSQTKRPTDPDIVPFEDRDRSPTFHEEGGVPLGPTDPTDFGSQPSALTYNDYYSEIRLRYVTGFQIMVQLQCKALVEKLNVSPLIVGIFGPIWLRFLASTGIMADGWADEAVLESESQLQGEAVDLKPRMNRNEPHNMLGKRAVMVWYKALHSSIPLPYSLAISFLVCHLARENVLPTDIVKWATDGTLPFLYAFVEIEKQIGPPPSACPLSSSRMFRPLQVISAHKVEVMAGRIAQTVGLQLPPVNFHGISSRILNQLGLPLEEILPQACRLYLWSMPPGLYLSANKWRKPTRICVMAILIVTIRMIFDLNGHGKWESSLSGSGNSSFNETEADEMYDADTLEDLSSHDSGFRTKLDAVHLLKILEKKYDELKDSYDYSKDLTSYLEYCNNVVFAGSGSKGRTTIEYEEEKLIEDFWSFYLNQQDKEPHPSDIGGDSMLKRPKTSKDGSKSSVKSIEDERIRLLKQDMADHKFRYIPPRKRIRTSSYLCYVRKHVEGHFVYCAHADYYILLRACAKVVKYEIRGLHSAVLALERRLMQLEKRIDCCFDVNTPSDEVVEDANDD